MLQENKMIHCAVNVLATAALVFSFARVVFGGFEGLREYVESEIERIPHIGVVETGITREEMLSRFARFGPADYMQIYYDKKYNSNITKFFYRIDDDDTLFLMMVYSWTTGKIIDFDLVRGYQDWHFLSYSS